MATKKSSRASSTKKSTAKKSSSKKKSSTRKYGPKAAKSVERGMKAFKQGKLKSGSGRKVTNPKQAIAIGLSEARKSGAKVPKKKSSS
jgi:sRNA-binding protein